MAEDVSILSEIDEALRADTLQLFWARNARMLITFCVLSVLATAGTVLWKNHLRGIHELQTSLLARAAKAEQESKNDEAIGYYTQAESDGGGLAALAGIRHATLLLGMKQPDKALALYNQVSGGKFGDATASLHDYAALEALILTSNATGGVTQGKTAGNDVFHSSATEIEALDALKAGDNKTAALLLNSVLADETAPYTERVRTAELLDSVKEHGK